MIDLTTLLLFLAAASVLAATPGPGIFYVAARTVAGGRAGGFASTWGTALGGFGHVIAGALGLSALVMTSADAFTILKIVGAVYLIWIGIKTWRDAGAAIAATDVVPAGARRAFRDGVFVELANPKTAAFFIAFIPQFIDPAGAVGWQFVLLGTIVVILNTLADVVVVVFAGRARDGLMARPDLIRRLRQGSGAVICGLGVSLLFARRPM
jgi:threonine/homoserine/homoserine lactone efflux protein